MGSKKIQNILRSPKKGDLLSKYMEQKVKRVKGVNRV